MADFFITQQPTAVWEANNPTLQANELGVCSDLRDGVETDSLLSKLGNGVDSWNTLPNFNPSGSTRIVSTTVATDVGTKQALLSAVPTGFQRIVTRVVVRNASADLTAFAGEDGFYFGYNAGATGSNNLTFSANDVALLTTPALLIQNSGETEEGASLFSSVIGEAGEIFGISIGYTSIDATVDIDVHYYDVVA